MMQPQAAILIPIIMMTPEEIDERLADARRQLEEFNTTGIVTGSPLIGREFLDLPPIGESDGTYAYAQGISTS